MLPIQSRHPHLVAVLQAWIEEDATNDQEQITKSEEDTAELLQNLQANRVDFGEGHIYAETWQSEPL